MPFFRFHIDVDAPPEVVAERLRHLVRPEGDFFDEAMQSAWGMPDGECPFVGSVSEDLFEMSREIHYRNSFLPLLRGRIIATPTGTRVSVRMSLHPVTSFILAFCVVGAAYDALVHKSRHAHFFCVTVGIFAAFACLGFFPEALKAKRLISGAIGGRGSF